MIRRVLAGQIKAGLLQGSWMVATCPTHDRSSSKIARERGPSQAPLREALRGREALGVLEITPVRVARVRRPSTTEILEACAVRRELEVLGCRLAVPWLTDKDLDALDGYLEEMR